MASSSGNSVTSGSSESDLQNGMDQRKRKRMLSNRESARRSRMRKQKHLDGLMTQVSQLRAENSQILNSMNLTSQLYLNVDAENSVLKAQMDELTHRLNSLNDIINCVNSVNLLFDSNESTQLGDASSGFTANNNNNNTWGSVYVNNINQPMMGLAEMLMY